MSTHTCLVCTTIFSLAMYLHHAVQFYRKQRSALMLMSCSLKVGMKIVPFIQVVINIQHEEYFS